MSSANIITDANYNTTAEAAVVAAPSPSMQRIECRCSERDKAMLMRNARLLGAGQSALIRAFIRTPLELQRVLLEADEEHPPLLLVDTVSLAQGVNQIRRAGYNIDYTLHALNTLLAKPGLSDARKLELLHQASDNSLAAAKGFMATSEQFARLNELVAFELSLSRPVRFR